MAKRRKRSTNKKYNHRRVAPPKNDFSWDLNWLKEYKKYYTPVFLVAVFAFLTLHLGQVTVFAPIRPPVEIEAVVEEPEPPAEDYFISAHLGEIIDEPYEEEPYIEERKPMIALTFDDGPSIHTERILDVLETYGGQATFFVLGHRVEANRDIVERAVEGGNEIANHSWSHVNFGRTTSDVIAREIMDTSAIIEEVAGFSPPILRPPYGQTSTTMRHIAELLGYAIINWHLDTMDWRYRDVDHIYNVIMNRAGDGTIVLLHDIHRTTADAMEVVIPRLIEEGYQLVTVSYLLEHFYEELEPGKVYGVKFDLRR
ncbi:MAG: polysaccharide deacetylase family protein [Defluviitaleaceae bacterium]|nr:polysaccharide deacetylase family protein [Defluviitaleaceae bacterium]